MRSTHTMRRETATPEYTRQLVERDGVTKASRALGISTTTLHKARQTGVIAKVVEIAAAGLMQYNRPAEGRSFGAKMQEVPNLNPQLDTALYLIEVPAEKSEMVERFAEHLRAHVLRA